MNNKVYLCSIVFTIFLICCKTVNNTTSSINSKDMDTNRYLLMSKDYTCLFDLKSNESVDCFGELDWGLNKIEESSKWKFDGLKQITSVSSFNNSVCAINDKNELFCFGRDNNGLLGLGKLYTNKLVTKPVTHQVAKFFQISIGKNIACALDIENELYCWGDGSRYYNEKLNAYVPSYSPRKINNSVKFKQLSSKSDHICGISLEDHLYCWGRGNDGQLGVGTKHDFSSKPLLVTKLPSKKVSVGGNHTCMIGLDSQLYCWGMGQNYQLGTGHSKNLYSPFHVLRNQKFIDIALGKSHSCAIDDLNFLYCWGANDKGQVSAKSIIGQNQVYQVSNTKFSSVFVGENHTCALTLNENQVQCWGDNSMSQLFMD